MKEMFYKFLSFFWYPLCFLFWILVKVNSDNTFIDLCFVASLVIFVIYLVYLVRFFVSETEENATFKSERVKVFCGAPGSGKTSKGLHSACKVARKNWLWLKNRHFYYKRRLKFFNKKPIKYFKQLDEFKEVEKAYVFWSKRKDLIPCLVSNIPLKQGKKFAYKLTKNHVLQFEALPFRSVVFCDEIGTWFSQLQSTDKTLGRLQMSDFVRLIRHFIDGHFFATEQDSGSIDIEIRRRVATNTAMHRQIWKCESMLLRFLSNFAEKFLPYFLEDLIKQVYMRVGFRRYEYVNEANTERTVNVNLNNGEGVSYLTYITPAMLNYQYDSRTFKNAYLVKDKAISLEAWDRLIPTVEELRNLGYFDNYFKMQKNKL